MNVINNPPMALVRIDQHLGVPRGRDFLSIPWLGSACTTFRTRCTQINNGEGTASAPDETGGGRGARKRLWVEALVGLLEWTDRAGRSVVVVGSLLDRM